MAVTLKHSCLNMAGFQVFQQNKVKKPDSMRGIQAVEYLQHKCQSSEYSFRKLCLKKRK